MCYHSIQVLTAAECGRMYVHVTDVAVNTANSSLALGIDFQKYWTNEDQIHPTDRLINWPALPCLVNIF